MAQDTTSIRIFKADKKRLQRVQAEMFAAIIDRKAKGIRIPTQADAIRYLLDCYDGSQQARKDAHKSCRKLKKQTAAG